MLRKKKSISYNFISLGYFCNIASDLGKMGLRKYSLPFDWLLTPRFSSVISLIENNFHDFLLIQNLIKDDKEKNHFFDKNYNIGFFHDFDEDQFELTFNQTQKKYMRRIERFYNVAKTPSVFIRYISNEETDSDGYSLDYIYLVQNYNSIIKLLKRFNDKNELILISNDDLKEIESTNIKIYKVPKDDVVSRRPLRSNKSLKKMLKSFGADNIIGNKFFYLKSVIRKRIG